MKFLSAIQVVKPGIWIGLIVLLLVGGRLYWVKASRPAHAQEIAAAFGSVSLFFGEPQMNHDGSQITYVATGAHAYNLFLCDTATGRNQIVSKEIFKLLGDTPDLRAWPWSPDGRAFLYSTRDHLFLCPAADVTASQVLPVDIQGMSDLVWVNPTELAWLKGETIGCANKTADGSWEVRILPHKGQILCLTAVDEHTIAWLQNDYLCRLDLTKALASTNNPFLAVSTNAPTLQLTNNLKLWLDASTLRLSNAAPVTLLADLSGAHNDAVANRNPPLFTAPDNNRALNKKGTIHFTPGDSVMAATGLKTVRKLGLVGPQPRTVFAVMRRRATGLEMVVSLGATRARGNYFGISDQFSQIYLPGCWGDADQLVPKHDGWKILEIDSDGRTENGYINGILQGTAHFPIDTVDREAEIGLRTGNSEAGSDGDLAELLVYDRVLEPHERHQVEAYLSRKWFNIALSSHDNPLAWCDPQVDGLVSFTYSKDNGRFLLRSSVKSVVKGIDKSVDSIWRYDPNAPDGLARVVADKSAFNEAWSAGNDFAYASQAVRHNGITLADSSEPEKSRLFKHGNVKSFSVSQDGQKLLILGTLTNEPSAGIWQYDLATSRLKVVVDASEYPSPYAKSVTSFESFFQLPEGGEICCTVYPPANFDYHKKYPLVLGDTYFGSVLNGAHGRLWVPAVANAGAFVVIVNRWSWLGDIQNWERNVMVAYQNFTRDSRIDPGQVYLFGASAETPYLSECLARSPGLWRGVIFLNPTQLPDFSNSPWYQTRPRILISAGGEEHEENRLTKYQASVLKNGVLVDFISHPGEWHHLVGNAAQLERTRAIMHFIFEE